MYKRQKWKGPVFEISALTREGCEVLIRTIYKHVHEQQQIEAGPKEIDPRFVEVEGDGVDLTDPRFAPRDSE